jgi:hypothetical protein
LEHCKFGHPIDDDRIKKYEMMCHYLIRRHFPGLIFPKLFEYEDVMNACRYEIYQAFKRLDPQKVASGVPAEKKRKIAEKAQDPEGAFQKAEKHVVYWQLDFFLKRLKWNYGINTASKKRKASTVSLEGYLVSKEAPDATDLVAGIQSIISDPERETAEALKKSLSWILRYRGPEKVRAFYSKMSREHQELVREHLFSLVNGKEAKGFSIAPVVTEHSPDGFFSQFIG